MAPNPKKAKSLPAPDKKIGKPKRRTRPARIPTRATDPVYCNFLVRNPAGPLYLKDRA
jgi:hypothetical protein